MSDYSLNPSNESPPQSATATTIIINQPESTTAAPTGANRAAISLLISPQSAINVLAQDIPPNVPETSPKASLPPSSIGIPSTTLKPMLSLAQMRSSRRKLLRLKPSSPTTMRIPSAQTDSSQTLARLWPPSQLARAMHAWPSGFVSETTARWSYLPGRIIMRYHTSQNSMQTPPMILTDQSR